MLDMKKKIYLKCKQILFTLFVIYFIGYIITFLIKNKILHFEQWIILGSILYYFYIILIIPLNKIIMNILIFGFTILFAIFLKINLIGINYTENILKKISNNLDCFFKFYILLGVLYILFRKLNLRKNRIKNNSKIYPERKEDLKHIYNFLKNEDSDINILGIDNKFGFGKTFLLEEVIKDIDKNEFEIIKIRCLLLEKEEVYIYISNLLNKILIKNFIFSGHFNKLKNSFFKSMDNKFLGGFLTSFIRDTSIDDIENFKEAIFRLNKTIVLIFDDLDRTENSEKIEKILSFIDDFSFNNIKSIVLFNLENLENINKKYTRDYIEKYIPLTKNLTEISFENLLKIELKEKELKEEKFEFIISLFEVSDKNYLKSKRDKIEFIDKFKSLTNKEILFNNKATPRMIKNFISDFKIYLNYKELIDVEERLEISYFFLKNFMFNDFYEKIELTSSFKEIYPINLNFISKQLDINFKMDIEKYSLIKKIASDIRKSFNTNLIKDNQSFIIMNNIILELKSDKIGSLNYFLKNLKMKELIDASREEIIKKILEVEENLKNLEIEIDDNSQKNILIYAMFDYSLISDKNNEKVFENNQKIERIIKKLKFVGIKEYESNYKKYYKKLKIILDEKKINIKLEKYQELLTNYYKSYSEYDGVFYFGEKIEEKTMLILDIFDDEDRKIKYLDIIYNKNNNKITDIYITTFLKSNIVNKKIIKDIIDNFIKNNYKITNRRTLNLIREKINIFLNIDIGRYNIQKTFTNKEFYEFYKVYLEEILNKDNKNYKSIVEISKLIKKSIYMNILFLNILLKLENNIQEEEEDEINISVTFSKEHEETITKLNSFEEQIDKLETLYQKGMNINEIQRIYDILE